MLVCFNTADNNEGITHVDEPLKIRRTLFLVDDESKKLGYFKMVDRLGGYVECEANKNFFAVKCDRNS